MSAEMEKPSAGSGKRLQLKPGPVIVVDDDADEAWLTMRAVSRFYPGSQILIFSGGGELFAYLEGSSRPFGAPRETPGLIFLDLHLQDMNGFSVMRWLRTFPICTGVPIVALTGFEDPRLVDRAYQAGATTFLRKPLAGKAFEYLVNSFVLPAPEPVVEGRALQVSG